MNGLMKAYAYDKVGELRQSRHSQRGDVAHAYDATGRIERSTRQPLARPASAGALPSAPSEAFQYDPAGNLLDNASQAALQSRTQHPQAGYVKDNLVRVFEDKRFFYDGHGRLIRKLSGRHTAQRFIWDEENRLIEVSTTRRPGTEHESTQRTRFDYDALGRRVAKHDAFGTTTFIWEGMRLIEERRGSSVISYVYEPDSYVPLARLDASGEKTEQGGLGTQDDAVLPPLPLGEGGGEGHTASNSIAARAIQTGAEGRFDPKTRPAANDAESAYWASLNATAKEQAQALEIPHWGTGTDGPAHSAAADTKLCEVYYFHTDQVGMPEELSNAQGQLVWQATYKTWGNTVAEQWQIKDLDGGRVHALDAGDVPEPESRQQNLRFQGQYLDRDTGLHYNTFRYYDPDIGRFISPDPIGLDGGINLGSYSPNPITWIDPWGWAGCDLKKVNKKTHDYELSLSKSKYPETFGHIGDAIKAGQSRIVTIDRSGAASNRRASLKGYPTKPKLDRDEWPMAMFKEGGSGASVRHINPSDNRGAGSSIGKALESLPDGTRVKIKIVK